MKNSFLLKRYPIVLSFMLLSSSIAIVTNEYKDEYTEIESLSQDQKTLYICFDEKMSNIATVIREIAALDQGEDSPLRSLKQALDEGYLFGTQKEVLYVLDYADWFVEQLPNNEVKKEIFQKLDAIIENVLAGALFVDEETVMHSANPRVLTIDKSMSVKEKIIFKNIVVMDKKLRVHGKARFYDNVSFNNVNVDGTISVQDEVVGCNLTVGCNINMMDSIDADHGNIVKNGITFIHNFGTDNTFVGENSGNFTMSGNGQNAAFGTNTLTANTTGESNVAIGVNALQANQHGNQNVAIGVDALSNYGQKASVAVGYQALQFNQFFENTAVGFKALQQNIGGGRENTAVGVLALSHNTTGIGNTAIGSLALQRNITGGFNSAVGANSLFFNNGTNNTAIGNSALLKNTTGIKNTAVGNAALLNCTIGSQNIGIGYSVGGLLVTGSNNIYIDGSGSLSPTDESDTIRIGNTQTRFFAAGVRGVTTDVNDAIPVFIDSNGQLGTTSSSRQFKHDIQQMTDESAAILQLNPVSFIYNVDESQTRQFGLIAEEVDMVFPRLVIRDKNGAPYTVRYEVLPVLLLNEMKKLVDTTVTKEEMQKLVDRIAALEKMLSQIN